MPTSVRKTARRVTKSRGEIRPDSPYDRVGLMRAFGIGWKLLSELRQRGLKSRPVGNKRAYFGADVIDVLMREEAS